MPLALQPGYRVFAGSGPASTPKNPGGILSWACVLLQSPPSSERPPAPLRPKANGSRGSSHEVFFPYSVSPHRTAALGLAGFASPDRLRLQVFSTSWRFDPPRACWPCFMPDPLMGLCPSELCSSRAAARRLRRRCPLVVLTSPPTCLTPAHTRPKPHIKWSMRSRPRERPRLQGFAPRESPLHHRRRFRPTASTLLSWALYPPGCSP
jgi:hypothetical protein